MNDIRLVPLGRRLHAAAAELAAAQPPRDLRDRIQRAVRPARRGRPFAMALALSTAVVAVLATLLVLAAPPSREDGPPAVLASDFIPLAGSERWREAAARGSAWLVPTELTQARLAALGLPYDPARADQSVRAQLLVHSSGDVLAVRVIR